jgi:hypothetical protein
LLLLLLLLLLLPLLLLLLLLLLYVPLLRRRGVCTRLSLRRTRLRTWFATPRNNLFIMLGLLPFQSCFHLLLPHTLQIRTQSLLNARRFLLPHLRKALGTLRFACRSRHTQFLTSTHHGLAVLIVCLHDIGLLHIRQPQIALPHLLRQCIHHALTACMNTSLQCARFIAQI